MRRIYFLLSIFFMLISSGCVDPSVSESRKQAKFPVDKLSAEYPDLVEWQRAGLLTEYPPYPHESVLLFFTEESCGFCLSFQIGVLSVSDHAELINDCFFPIKVDLSSPENREFRDRFGIKGVPVLVVLDQKGKELGRLDGWPGVERTVSFLRKHASASTVDL